MNDGKKEVLWLLLSSEKNIFNSNQALAYDSKPLNWDVVEL